MPGDVFRRHMQWSNTGRLWSKRVGRVTLDLQRPCNGIFARRVQVWHHRASSVGRLCAIPVGCRRLCPPVSPPQRQATWEHGNKARYKCWRRYEVYSHSCDICPQLDCTASGRIVRLHSHLRRRRPASPCIHRGRSSVEGWKLMTTDGDFGVICAART